MKKWILLVLFCFQTIYCNQSLEEYFAYLDLLSKPNGSHHAGEIEIITDLEKIKVVESVQEERLLKKGFSQEDASLFSRVGIVSEDQYWIWLRDAVYFPGGIPGTYDRLVWKIALERSFPAVAILPVLPSGNIVLNLNYRHASRSWELELPRGMVMPNETVENAALREMREETGLIAPSVAFLGEMTPDTGALGSIIPVFFGQVSEIAGSENEYSEAIADVLDFSIDELKQGLLKGFLEVNLNGKKQNIPLRDPFLTFALFQAELRGLL